MVNLTQFQSSNANDVFVPPKEHLKHQTIRKYYIGLI